MKANAPIIDRNWSIGISNGTAQDEAAGIFSTYTMELPYNMSGILEVRFSTNFGFVNSTTGLRRFRIKAYPPYDRQTLSPTPDAGSWEFVGSWHPIHYFWSFPITSTSFVVLQAAAWSISGAFNYYVSPNNATLVLHPY